MRANKPRKAKDEGERMTKRMRGGRNRRLHRRRDEKMEALRIRDGKGKTHTQRERERERERERRLHPMHR